MENFAVVRTRKSYVHFLHINIKNNGSDMLCITIIEKSIISDQQVCLEDLEPYNIKEVDKRMLLHTLAAQSFQKITIKTAGGDVVVIADGKDF